MDLVCPNCKRPLVKGERVIETFVIEELPPAEGFEGKRGELVYQHAKCENGEIA